MAHMAHVDGEEARTESVGGGGLVSSGALVVLITHPVDGAPEFARGLVERNLAACVNVLPVTSVYRWQGAVEEEGERLMLVKTRRERLAEIEAHVATHHPYDVPECVALEPVYVEARYLDWLLAQTGESASGKEKKA